MVRDCGISIGNSSSWPSQEDSQCRWKPCIRINVTQGFKYPVQRRCGGTPIPKKVNETSCLLLIVYGTEVCSFKGRLLLRATSGSNSLLTGGPKCRVLSYETSTTTGGVPFLFGFWPIGRDHRTVCSRDNQSALVWDQVPKWEVSLSVGFVCNWRDHRTMCSRHPIIVHSCEARSQNDP